MTRPERQAYSLLPRLDETYFMVRVLAFVGIGLWIIFVPNSPLDKYPVLLLLGAFALHLLFVLFSISHKLVRAWTMHVLTLGFDLVFLTLLTRFSGGTASPMIALYYLFLPFASYLLGFRVAIFTAMMSTLLYLAANFTLPGATFSGSILMNLTVLWLFCIGLGYYSNFTGQSEKRLLRALDKLNQRTTELERAHRHLELVYEVSRDLAAILEVDNLIERVLWISRNLFGFPAADLYTWDEKKKLLLHRGHINGEETVIYTEPRPARITSAFKTVLETGKTQRIASQRRERAKSSERELLRSQLVVPLLTQGQKIGLLCAGSPDIGAFSQRDEHSYAVLANSAALALENAVLHGKMEKLTTVDELTGVFNFRYFKNRLADEMRRSVRYGQPLSLIMIDIDWFKRFNDTYGHETGNKILQGIVKASATCIRDVDILCRYGGEEFIVILPQTGQAEAYRIGERIREKIAETRFEVGPDDQNLAKVTVSIGISCYPENGRPTEELVEAVDQALYRAKGAGKNLVCSV